MQAVTSIPYLIRDEYSKCRLLRARGFWTSDDTVNDGCDNKGIIEVEISSEEPSNIHLEDPFYKADICANENCIKDEGKGSESQLSNASQLLFEPPVKDIYLYLNSDDSSMSSFGSLFSRLLPKVVSRKLPILTGSWNNEKVVTLSTQSDLTIPCIGDLSFYKGQDNIQTKKGYMYVLERISQGYKHLKQDLFGSWLLDRYDTDISASNIIHGKESQSLQNNHTYANQQPVRYINLNYKSDDSSLSTFDSLGYQSLPKVNHRKNLILKGSWNEKENITVLYPNLSTGNILQMILLSLIYCLYFKII